MNVDICIVTERELIYLIHQELVERREGLGFKLRLKDNRDNVTAELSTNMRSGLYSSLFVRDLIGHSSIDDVITAAMRRYNKYKPIQVTITVRPSKKALKNAGK